MKKNLLFVIPTLRMGGAEKALVSLLKALDPQRVDVDLYLFETGGVLQAEVPGWVNILEADPVTRAMTLEIRFYLKSLLVSGHWLAAATRLWTTLRSKFRRIPSFNWSVMQRFIPSLPKHYDVAIGYLEGFPNFFILDKVSADRKIGWIHSDFSGRRFSPREKAYYCRLDHLVTISEVCRNAFVNILPETAARFHVMENLVLPREVLEKAQAAPATVWQEDLIHLITVGRLEYAKGIDVGIRTAALLKDRGLPFRWHVFGDGSMKQSLEQLIAELSVGDVFLLEGQAGNPYPYIKNAHILVQPSRWEGKSLVLDEAKILGKAIVVTGYPSVSDQITDRVTGIITGMEPESIADGIELLIKDPALKEQLENNAAKEPNRSIRALELFYELINT